MKGKRPDNKKYYLVAEDILPHAVIKAAQVKEMLAKGEFKTVQEAADFAGLSRSAFYKYKDGVYPFYQAIRDRIITVSMLLEHKRGVLSTILNTIAAEQGNILTINQGIPLQGVANVTLAIETAGMTVSVDKLLNALRLIKGVTKVELVGEE